MRLLFSLLFLPLLSFAQLNTEIIFDVTFNGKNIGTVKATEKTTGNHIVKDLKSDTDTKVLVMSIHVETEVNATYDKETFLKGTAFRHANRGVNDVHASTTRVADKQYKTERDGKQIPLNGREVGFCVIDLYFKEPKGLTDVYSNMYTAFVQIKEVSPGKYLLENPDGVKAWYSYKAGKLTQIEVETKVGKVVSVRKQ